jgi:hypothetical protein
VYTNGYCLPLLNTNAVSYRFVHVSTSTVVKISIQSHRTR